MFFFHKKNIPFTISTMTSYCLWRVIASLAPDLSKNFREAHQELARLTQVNFNKRFFLSFYN